DRTGQEIIPIEYDYAESFSEEGSALVRLNANDSYIDITGKVR
ncbi:MAG: WG repeat-containing protein, partial [Capnocytophaga granulosa]